MHRPFRRCANLALVSSALSILLCFGGCATAPTYQTRPESEARAAAIQHPVIVPVDAELSELTAGGVIEPHEDWTAAASKNLVDALVKETGFTAATVPTGTPASQELQEVQALVRAITLNHLMTRSGTAPPFPAAKGALTYNTGPMPLLAQATGADAKLFVFIRDSYATTGRKSLLALSVLGAAVTGVAIIPAMGSTAMTAALVDSDGTVLWFNSSAGGHDPRNPAGAAALVHALLTGMPRPKS